MGSTWLQGEAENKEQFCIHREQIPRLTDPTLGELGMDLGKIEWFKLKKKSNRVVLPEEGITSLIKV